MTELMVKLPDELAQRAKDAGLLSDSAIARLLDHAVRREADRRLLAVAERIQVACIAPMSMEEIAAEREADEPRDLKKNREAWLLTAGSSRAGCQHVKKSTSNGLDMSDFELIESLFVTLLLVLAGVFSESEVLEVREFVDAGEYPLALETTVDIFSEEKKLATEEIVALVRDLALAMGLGPETYTDRLNIE